jgi:D-tyrosyl-tRNA(Tyr) deacylase
MIGLLQRVSEARVEVDSRIIARIETGLLVLIGIEKTDTEKTADRLLERLLGYRVFPDSMGRMNRSVEDVSGGLLLVPQFTLVADTRKGTRPSFSSGAEPDLGARLFGYLLAQAQSRHPGTAAGCFGAAMQVALTNDGPVTFWLQV